MIEISSVLATLAKHRPLFHSEADFQHALAWELHRHLPEASIRLERSILRSDKLLHLDILVTHGDAQFAIELKYKTRALKVDIGDEQFKLLNQSAQDIGRYDFVKDIWRLEQMVFGQENVVGYAILLTNDSAYWKHARRSKTVDAAFRLQEGRILNGMLSWGDGASAGTKRGREESIELIGTYHINWQDYSEISDDRYGRLRFLTVEMRRVGIDSS